MTEKQLVKTMLLQNSNKRQICDKLKSECNAGKRGADKVLLRVWTNLVEEDISFAKYVSIINEKLTAQKINGVIKTHKRGLSIPMIRLHESAPGLMENIPFSLTYSKEEDGKHQWLLREK